MLKAKEQGKGRQAGQAASISVAVCIIVKSVANLTVLFRKPTSSSRTASLVCGRPRASKPLSSSTSQLVSTLGSARR